MRRFFTDRTPPNETELSHIYDRQAPTWLRGPGRFETWLVGSDTRNELVDNLRGDVLEIGVGPGDTLLRLSQRPHNVTSFTGIDLSAGMIAEANKIQTQFPVQLMVANAEDLHQFPDNSFDTVTASLVFCTVPDVPRAFAEIARVLKPDGRVILLEHVLSTNRVIARLQKWAAPQQIRLIGCHLDRTTEQTLRDCGYTIASSGHKRFGVVRLILASPPTT